MSEACPECGAAVPEGGTCRDHFHALLLLEHEVATNAAATAGGRGEAAHFRAVTAYVLQHPDGMGYTAEALSAARRLLADHLAGRSSVAALRTRVRKATNGPARVTRRPGEGVVRWPVPNWPVTVADVVAGGVAGYGERVAAWAESVLRTLELLEAETSIS